MLVLPEIYVNCGTSSDDFKHYKKGLVGNSAFCFEEPPGIIRQELSKITVLRIILSSIQTGYLWNATSVSRSANSWFSVVKVANVSIALRFRRVHRDLTFVIRNTGRALLILL